MNTVVRYRNGRNLMSQVDSIFDSMLEGMEMTGVRRPAVDVLEQEDAYVLTAELPGIDENDVEVTLEDGRLKIETRKEESAEESGNEGEGRYLLRERRKAVFSRSFGLPRDVDKDNINASFKNGILTLTLQKAEEAKPRSIKIN
jgi:HSP20 family protein